MRSKLTIACLAAAALAAAAPPARAQAVPGQFQVVPSGGWLLYDDASALDAAPTLGLDAAYFLTGNLAVGLDFHAARPTTKGEYFPLALMDFGDTTYVYAVSQTVTTVGAGAKVLYRIPFNRLEAHVQAGAGIYQIYMDPRRTQNVSRASGPSASIGGGLSYAVTETVGIRLEAKDVIYMDYDRDELDATISYVRNRRIPDLVPAPPEAKDVVHNIRFALGFSFIPGLSR